MKHPGSQATPHLLLLEKFTEEGYFPRFIDMCPLHLGAAWPLTGWISPMGGGQDSPALRNAHSPWNSLFFQGLLYILKHYCWGVTQGSTWTSSKMLNHTWIVEADLNITAEFLFSFIGHLLCVRHYAWYVVHRSSFFQQQWVWDHHPFV